MFGNSKLERKISGYVIACAANAGVETWKEERKMDEKKIISAMEENNYWDVRVDRLEALWFLDEVVLEYIDENALVSFEFKKCYKINFQQDMVYVKTKPMKECKFNERPYYIQDISVQKTKMEDRFYYEVKLNIWPMDLEIICEEIYIKRNNMDDVENEPGGESGQNEI